MTDRPASAQRWAELDRSQPPARLNDEREQPDPDREPEDEPEDEPEVKDEPDDPGPDME